MNEIKIIDMRVLPGDSAFLIDDGEHCVLCDTGFAFTGSKLADNVQSYLGERALDYIFLTHSHYDHALGSVYVKARYPSALVVAGEYAARIFAKPSARALMRELDNKFAKASGVFEYTDLIDDLAVDIPVSDGDRVTVGDMEFEVVNLPGHTKCSVGFYCKKHKLLVGTETLGVYGGDGIVVPSYLVGYQMALDSIARASLLDIDNILVPHYGLLGKEESKEYLKTAKQSAIDTAKLISDMLRRGCEKREIVESFKQKFYHGYIRTVYPIDAMELNTGITVDLIERELL